MIFIGALPGRKPGMRACLAVRCRRLFTSVSNCSAGTPIVIRRSMAEVLSTETCMNNPHRIDVARHTDPRIKGKHSSRPANKFPMLSAQLSFVTAGYQLAARKKTGQQDACPVWHAARYYESVARRHCVQSSAGGLAHSGVLQTPAAALPQ